MAGVGSLGSLRSKAGGGSPHRRAAHSSGSFASCIAYAGMRFGHRVMVVMPQTAPRVKFEGGGFGSGAAGESYRRARERAGAYRTFLAGGDRGNVLSGT